MLPLHRHATEIRLITDFVIQVVEFAQFLHDLARDGQLNFEQRGMFEREHLFARARRQAIDVVHGIQRAGIPHGIFVHRAEQVHLHHDAAFLGLREEIAQPIKICLVPFAHVELVSTLGIPGHVAARPGADEAFGQRSECVLRNAERGRGFAIDAAERARVIQLVPLQFIKVPHVIEVEVHHRAVMLSRRDQERRLAVPEEVVRILWMQCDRRFRRQRTQRAGEEEQANPQDLGGPHNHWSVSCVHVRYLLWSHREIAAVILLTTLIDAVFA